MSAPLCPHHGTACALDGQVEHRCAQCASALAQLHEKGCRYYGQELLLVSKAALDIPAELTTRDADVLGMVAIMEGFARDGKRDYLAQTRQALLAYIVCDQFGHAWTFTDEREIKSTCSFCGEERTL